MRIDAHQHFWNLQQFPHPWITPELKAIRRDFGPADLKPLLDRHGLDGCVLVQTFSSLEETRYFLSLAIQHDFIRGVVGWVDLQDPAVSETLEALEDHPKLVGIRHVVHDEPDVEWLVRPAVRRGLAELARRGMPYDLLIRPPHLPAALAVARQLPELPLVIDHLAKPRIAQSGWEDWRGGMEQLAELPNVYCKLSGLITEASWATWTPKDLQPYLEWAMEHFSADRLMYGSDWPVCLLAGSYDRVVEALEVNLGALPTADREKIWGRTAAKFYRLDVASDTPAP